MTTFLKLRWKALPCAFFLAAHLLLCGCDNREARHAGKIASIRDLDAPEFIIGSMTGSAALREAAKKLPRATFREYAMPIDAFTALCSRKIDAVVLDRPTLKFMSLAHPELAVMPENLAEGRISVAAAKRNTALMEEVNRFIRQFRKTRQKEMVARWFEATAPAMPELPQPEDPAGVLRIGVTANNEPLCFIQNGKLAGYDTEFALRLAAALNRKAEFVDTPYDALVSGLESGKIDLAVAFMDALPEREESVLFSEPYIDAPITVLLHKKMLKQNAAETAAPAEPEFLDRLAAAPRSIAESFQKTFLRENRWVLILQGLGTTLVITFFSVLLGTLLAFPVCMACRSGHPLLKRAGESFVSIIMGTPILVILTLLYYVVFAKIDVSAIVAAILSFALEFSAYAGVTLRSGIESVPRGQTEAALALGHSPASAFRNFVLPQAVRTILPVYRGEIISTLKSTSIVGYVAIMDLTKMSEIIRSRTYEAFFPLIAVAILYYLSARGLTAILILLEKRIDPALRRKSLR